MAVRPIRIGRLSVYILVAALAVDCSDRPQIDPETVTGDALAAFGSAEAFDAYLERLAAAQRQVDDYERAHSSTGCSGDDRLRAFAPAEAPAYDSAESNTSSAESIGGGESITNNQETGVDEGDIVKAHGPYLVILRRGRLFSVRLEQAGAADLTPVSRIDAFAPGSELGSWYDELLIHRDQVIVIGYSYQVRATEVGLFSIDETGKLRHERTFFVRSNDYYSVRNYASRLVDGKLVLYMPYWLMPAGGAVPSLPAVGHEDAAGEVSWSAVIDKTRIVRPIQPTLYPVLHTVVRCDLEAAERSTLGCEAAAVLGPFSRTFYVSRDAAYVWVSEPDWPWFPGEGASDAVVYRLPLGGDDEITALRARGQPIDQFSFKEDAGGHLNVVVTGNGVGDFMAAPERASGAMALMRVPLSDFSAAARAVAPGRITALPQPNGAYGRQNRFVGDYLLYGSGGAWWEEVSGEHRLYLKAYRTADPVQQLPIGHRVERIEALGERGALVAGNDADGDLLLSSVTLSPTATIRDVFTRTQAMQGERRSHGFFFKGDAGGGGVLGLPVRRDGDAWGHLLYGSADVLFVRVATDLSLSSLGALFAADDQIADDRCVVSCFDWYGNARPIFYRARAFALLGYELVEGRLGLTSLREVARTSFLLPSRN